MSGSDDESSMRSSASLLSLHGSKNNGNNETLVAFDIDDEGYYHLQAMHGEVRYLATVIVLTIKENEWNAEAISASIEYVNKYVVACNRKYQGHLLLGLVRLAPRPEVQLLLLPMDIHRVSCLLIYFSIKVTCEGSKSLYDSHPQVLFNVLVTAAEVVVKHYNGDPNVWRTVVDSIYMLVPSSDVDKFIGYCNCGEYGLSEDDRNGVIDLRIVFDVNNEDEDGCNNDFDSG